MKPATNPWRFTRYPGSRVTRQSSHVLLLHDVRVRGPVELAERALGLSAASPTRRSQGPGVLSVVGRHPEERPTSTALTPISSSAAMTAMVLATARSPAAGLGQLL